MTGGTDTFSHTLTTDDSGALCVLTAFSADDDAIDINLPSCATAGLNYKIVVKGDIVDGTPAILPNGSDKFAGVAMLNGGNDNGDALDIPNTSTKLQLGSGTFGANSKSGDYLEFVSDGDIWYVSGATQVAGGFKVT